MRIDEEISPTSGEPQPVKTELDVAIVALQNIDQLSQETSDNICALARALEKLVATETERTLARLIVQQSDMLMNDINARAESCGANYSEARHA
jgi:glutamyl-tRNA reductase